MYIAINSIVSSSCNSGSAKNSTARFAMSYYVMFWPIKCALIKHVDHALYALDQTSSHMHHDQALYAAAELELELEHY